MNSTVSDTQSQQPGLSWLRQRMVQYALIGIVGGFIFPLVASAIKVGELRLPVTLLNLLAMQRVDPVIWITDTAPFFLGLLAAIAGRREDLLREANRRLTQRDADLNLIHRNLEESVAERTRQLDQRNAQMRSVVTFARQIADIHDVSLLLSTSVQVISERFEHFDVDLYLLDDSRQSAVLRASSSASGRALVREGHRVVVGDQSAVGRAAKRGTLLISPVRAEGLGEADHGAAPSGAVEITLPLVARSKVIGVLDVHARGAESAGQTEAEILQLLADQLAATIENTRLASESRAALEQLAAVSAQSTRSAWQQYLKGSSVAYQFTPGGVRPVTLASGNGASGGLRFPLRLRGEEIGAIAVKRNSGAPWTETERDLMEKLAAQVALAVENARLIEETRQRAAQEQMISEISARFSRSLDVEALLQAAVREFAALPEVAEATVVLKPAAEAGPQATG